MKPVDPLLEFEFRKRGALTASDLCAALRISQPTLSRHLARLGGRIIRMGRGRSTRYAMAREVAGAESSWPLYTIDSHGRPNLAGVLHALQRGQWYLEQGQPWDALRGGDFPLGLYPDLPWFVDDLRPQGFLGRAFVRTYSRALGFPADLRSWSGDHVVSALLRFGQDLQGAFVIGEIMLTAVQDQVIHPPEAAPAAARAQMYPRLAEAMLAGDWPGSSAAGEQPKFVARIRGEDQSVRHVIVKFSGRAGRPEDRRWADLLAAEHIASALLSANGILAAETSLMEADGRVFLESRRFDREGEHGRRGLVSLAALDGAFFGEPHTPWTAAARRLQTAGWLTEEDARRLTILWWFGSLIANTDMHYGNVSLFLDRSRPLTLAPAYDMLPMLYRPDPEGALPERSFNPSPPLPESLGAWIVAVELAEIFWARVSTADSVSGPFRSIGARNREIVEKYGRHFG
jgi:DNA-binding transcriptional ArsR family regulator